MWRLRTAEDAGQRGQTMPVFAGVISLQDRGQSADRTRWHRTIIQHRQVIGIPPVGRAPRSSFTRSKRRAGQRIGHGHANIVGLAIVHHLQGQFDIRAGFAGIAKLQEKADTDAMFVNRRVAS